MFGTIVLNVWYDFCCRLFDVLEQGVEGLL